LPIGLEQRKVKNKNSILLLSTGSSPARKS
jgi:hypothetical protein